jgi:hypothetical protein
MRWAGHVARIGRRGMHIGYWGKSIWKETTGKPRRSWVDNIKMDLREIGWDGMNWIDRLRIGSSGGSCGHVMNLRVP